MAPPMHANRPRPFEIRFLGPHVGHRFPSRHTDANRPDLTWPAMDKIASAEDSMRTGSMVALVGSRGSGKTQLALWLATRFDKPYIYMRVDDMCSHLKMWLSLDHEGKNNNHIMLKRVPLLIIDEFQERQRTEFEDLSIVSLIDKRYGEGLPTIIIANLKPSDFAKDAGSSITSRLTEGGTMIVCDWPSFRGAKP